MIHQLQFQRVLACTCFLFFAVAFRQCEGFAGSSLPFQTSTTARRQRSSISMYVPLQQNSKEIPKVAQKMIPNPDSIAPAVRVGERKKSENKRRYSTELSNSVLIEGDTLPSFPTAHGLLSPETVMRMEEMVDDEGHSSEALLRFLKQYRRNGPMSCLSMLSDPDVLPHLTKAMRDVV